VFVVDAYTLHRLGLLHNEKASYEEMQELFEQALPQDPELFGEYHALLVRLAKEHCRARPYCKNCPLSSSCTYKSLM